MSFKSLSITTIDSLSNFGERISRRWLFSFILIVLVIGTTSFLIFLSFFPGDSFEAYRVIWDSTTQDQFELITRDQPWLLIIPAVTIIFVTGLLLPLTYWSRAVFVYIAFGVGVIFGHVFW